MGGIRSLGMLVVAVAAALVGQGCATGDYGAYYKATAHDRFARTKTVETRPYSDETLNSMQSNGYIVVGESEFDGPLEERECAIRQAKKVGADIVLLRSVYSHTDEELVPVAEYQPQETYTGQTDLYGTAPRTATPDYTASGPSGAVAMPVRTAMYDQKAVFLRRRAPH